MPARKTTRPTRLLHVGIRGHVVALRREDGEVAWSVKLRRGSTLVPLVLDGEHLYAVSGGEVSCLEAASGALLWHNPLKGYGMGFAMLAGGADPGAAAAIAAAAAAAAAAATAASASAAS